MNAEEMLKQSMMAARINTTNRKGKNGSKILPNGLTTRTHNILRRYGFTRGDYEEYDVDKEKVKKAILSGNIFDLRNTGIATVKELCEWLAKQ